jgi:hypothetical protein
MRFVARITQGSWTDTEATVAMTVDDPLNNQGRNSMLWLSEPVKAFHYAGLLRNGETGVQASLNKPLVIANIRKFGLNTLHLVLGS